MNRSIANRRDNRKQMNLPPIMERIGEINICLVRSGVTNCSIVWRARQTKSTDSSSIIRHVSPIPIGIISRKTRQPHYASFISASVPYISTLMSVHRGDVELNEDDYVR